MVEEGGGGGSGGDSAPEPLLDGSSISDTLRDSASTSASAPSRSALLDQMSSQPTFRTTRKQEDGD